MSAMLGGCRELLFRDSAKQVGRDFGRRRKLLFRAPIKLGRFAGVVESSTTGP